MSDNETNTTPIVTCCHSTVPAVTQTQPSTQSLVTQFNQRETKIRYATMISHRCTSLEYDKFPLLRSPHCKLVPLLN